MRRARILLVAWVLIVGAIGLWSAPVDAPLHGLEVSALRWLDANGLGFVTYSRVEFTANVIVFAVLGLLLALSLPGGWRWLSPIITAAISSMIELSQAAFLPGRFASVRDVAADSIGGVIGFVVAVVLLLVARRRETRSSLSAEKSM